MKIFKLSCFLAILFLINSCFNETPQKKEIDNFCGTAGINDNQNQPTVFKAKCAACHMYDKNSTGPKLKGVLNKVPNEEWFDEFVRNEDSLIKINDEYALKIIEWSPIDGNHNFKELRDEHLVEIKKYLMQK